MGMESFFKPVQFNFKLFFQIPDQFFRVVTEHIVNRKISRPAVMNHCQVRTDGHLAIGKGIKGPDRITGIDPAGQLDLDLNLLGRIIINRLDLDFTETSRLFNALNQRLRSSCIWDLLDKYGLFILFNYFGPAFYPAVSLVIVGDIQKTTLWKIRVHFKRLVF